MNEQYRDTTNEGSKWRDLLQRVRRVAGAILRLPSRQSGTAESAGPALSVHEQLEQLVGAGDISRLLTREEGARWRTTLLGLVQAQQELRPARSVLVNGAVESIYAGFEQRYDPEAGVSTTAAVHIETTVPSDGEVPCLARVGVSESASGWNTTPTAIIDNDRRIIAYSPTSGERFGMTDSALVAAADTTVNTVGAVADAYKLITGLPDVGQPRAA